MVGQTPTTPTRGRKAARSNQDVFRIWCLVSNQEHFEAEFDELPARCIPLLRSNKDIAVIPGGHESTREFAEFCKEVLTLKDEQIVYTDDQQRSFNESLGNFTDSVKDRVLSFASKSQDEEWLLIPFSITSRLRDLEVVLKRQLGTKNIKIVGESKEWMSRFGNRGVIHRHVSDLDKLSIIEELGLDITVPRGFTCSDDKQLLVAFRLLTDGDPNVQVVIKPILSSGQGMLSPSSAEELRFYDFPYGDVILQEYLQVDRSPDGMHVSPTVQYMQNDLLDGRPCERIIMGSMTYGLRSCTATQEFMDKISQHSSRLVEAIAPSGMGAFAFTSVDGKPYLTDAHAGTLCMEHFTKLFHEMYAKDARFCSWNFYPHPGMDVWTLWTRLCDRNIAFMPGKSKRGVFPLLFLKNTTATLISIGVDDADVSLLRSQAEHVMRLVDLSNKIESVALSENRRQLWIQSPRPEYKLVTQRYNLPNRCIGLLRPGVDVIVLPGGHEPTREFWSFMKDVLDLGEDQVIFSSGDSYCLDDDINETILSRLRSIIQSSGNSWTLVPYMVTSNFQRWACQLADLDVSVFGEDLEWVQKFGSKGILHRHVRSLDTPSIIEEIDPNIRVARGYGCSTVDDLVEAYKLLDCKEVVIKPVFGAAGEGIIFCSELEQLKMYDFPMGDVCLEEFLDLDKAPDGLVLSPAMHYNEGVLIGKGLVDQIMVGTSYMGWRKSGATKVFQKTANRYMQNVIQATKPRGPGGVDFLSVNGLPVLSDINTGRFNGAHFPKLFQARYAPDSSFYCWKTAPALDFDVYAFWSRLVSNGIAFIPGKSTRGIFPLLFLRGLSGLYVAFGDTNEEAEALYKQGDALISKFDKNARIPIDLIVPKPSFFKKADIMRKAARRIWVTSSIPEIRRPQTRYECSLRPTCLLRPGLDLIVLQGDHEGAHDYFEFCKEILKLEDGQVIWTAGNPSSLCLDDEIDQGVIDRIKNTVSNQSDQQFILVPMTVTDNFQRWANNIDNSNLKVFGEHPEWISKFGDKKAIFRSISSPTSPSLVESLLGKKCRVIRGFVCENSEELVSAFEELGLHDGETAVIRPVDSVDGRASKIVRSIEEVRLYDFADGTVVLRENVQLDKAPDGLPITTSVAYMKGEIFGQGFTDVVSLGNRKQCIRKSVTSLKFQDQITLAANAILKEMKPEGPGLFDFGSIDGEPILLEMETNVFTSMHYAKLFLETHATGSVFYMWNSHPPSDLDIWTFWSRLVERGIAFIPGKSKSGVFPLLFLRNQSNYGIGTYISIASDDSEAMALKEQAETASREVCVNQNVESVSLSRYRRRIWVQSCPLSEVRKPHRRFQLAAKAIACVRPHLDIIILPGGYKPIKEYWEFCRNAMNLDKSQAIFTSGENLSLDDDIDDSILSQLKGIIISGEDKWTLVPYMVTPTFQRWASSLSEFGVAVFGEELEFTEKFGSKGVLHRHVSSPNTPSAIEQLDPSIPVARGYRCSTVDDLLEAYRLLDVKDIIIKPIYGTDGDGILVVSEMEQLKMYDFPLGEVCVEEFLNLDKAPDGLILSPALHYNEGVLLGKGLVDQIIVGYSCMGWRKSIASKIFQKSANRYFQSIVSKMKPKGPGGMDFVSVGGNPVLCSLKAGRFRSGHFPKLFLQMYAHDKTYYCWEHRPTEDLDIQTFWKRLKNAGCNFVPGQSSSGVFPIQFLRGVAGMFIAIGRDEHACMALHDKANNLLKPSVPPLPVVSQQMQSRFKLTLIKNAEAIFAPEVINAKHILVGGTQVVGLLDDQAAAAIEAMSSDISTRIVDATGCIVVPGFVDIHVHITGGGGELGPASRTPEAKVGEMLEGGLTTVVGVLGTDCVSRSLENLLTKCRGLNEDGITAYMWTGAYRIPAPNITGSVRRDICLLEQCIGVGECAISDHRGSQPSSERILDVASDCRVGGLLSGKAGVMYCHMGFGDGLLQPLWKAMKESDIPITTFLPTHMERSEALIEDGARWIRKGGYVDFTCRTVKARLALRKYHQEGLPMDHVMVSSDSYGSLPSFDDDGNLVRYTYGHPKAFLQFIWKMYFQEQWPLDRILPLVTKNPAKFLKLKGKGEISVGSDADVLLLDKNTLKLKSVLAKGEVMMTPKWVHQGMFGTPNPEKVGSKPKRSHSFNNNTSCC